MRYAATHLLGSMLAFGVLGCALSHGVEARVRDGGADANGAPDAHYEDASEPRDACVPRAELCDGRDQDCDGRVDEDADDDCAIEHGTGVCAEGACQIEGCEGDFGDCDGDPSTGCEADLAVERAHCGSCGVECGLTEACVEGRCQREDVLDITAGYAPCALLASGRVLCWGGNFAGHAGNGTLVDTPVPTEVVGISDAVRLRGDGGTTCVMHRAGTLSCWGEGQYGTRGDGTFELAGPEPRPVVDLGPVVDFVVHAQHGCALKTAGEVWCWGVATGLPGDGRTNQSRPVRIDGLPPVRRLFESRLSFVEADDGRVFGWSWDGGGLPAGARTSVPQPLELLGGATTVYGSHPGGCAVFAGGVLSCWGRGLPGYGLDRERPFGPVEGFPPVTTVTAWPSFVAAVTTDARLIMWADEPWLPPEVPQGVPTLFPDAVGVREVALGVRVMCILVGTNDVRCAGENSRGQVGDGTTELRSRFVAVHGFE